MTSAKQSLECTVLADGLFAVRLPDRPLDLVRKTALIAQNAAVVPRDRVLDLPRLPLSITNARFGEDRLIVLDDGRGAWCDDVAYVPSFNGHGDDYLCLHLPMDAVFLCGSQRPRVVVSRFSITNGRLNAAVIYLHRDDAHASVAYDRKASSRDSFAFRPTLGLTQSELLLKTGAIKVCGAAVGSAVASNAEGEGLSFFPVRALTKTEWRSLGWHSLSRTTKSKVFPYQQDPNSDELIELPGERDALIDAGVSPESLRGASFLPLDGKLATEAFDVTDTVRFASFLGCPAIASIPGRLRVNRQRSHTDSVTKLHLADLPKMDELSTEGVEVWLNLAKQTMSVTGGRFIRKCPAGVVVDFPGTDKWREPSHGVSAGSFDDHFIEDTKADFLYRIPSSIISLRVRVWGVGGAITDQKCYWRKDIMDIPLKSEQTKQTKISRKLLTQDAKARFGDRLPRDFSAARHSIESVESHLAILKQLENKDLTPILGFCDRFLSTFPVRDALLRRLKAGENLADMFKAEYAVVVDPFDKEEYLVGHYTDREIIRKMAKEILRRIHPALPKLIGVLAMDPGFVREFALAAISGE